MLVKSSTKLAVRTHHIIVYMACYNRSMLTIHFLTILALDISFMLSSHASSKLNAMLVVIICLLNTRYFVIFAP